VDRLKARVDVNKFALLFFQSTKNMKRANPSERWSKHKKLKKIKSEFFVEKFLHMWNFGDLLSILSRIVRETKKRESTTSSNEIVENIDNLYVCLYPITKPRTWDPFVGEYGIDDCDGLIIRGNQIHISDDCDDWEERKHDYVLLGWAMVRRYNGQTAQALTNFEMFVNPQHASPDFERRFFHCLCSSIGSLFVLRPETKDLDLWKRIRADRKTQRHYVGDLRDIGWHQTPKVKDMLYACRDLFPRLEQQMTQSRDVVLGYLYLALNCDFPILEALSYTWPPCHLGVIVQGENQLMFSKLRNKTAFPRIQTYSTFKIVFDASDWDAQYKEWPAIFQDCLLRYKGSVFHRLSYHD
jgi:hypothetical protein